jgi:predicted secreted protein
MFTDQRSKKVIFAAHCILNQNAKIDRCAHYPGAMQEVTQCLLDSGVGIIQLPCPELLLLGLDRQVDTAAQTTVESEDTRVAQRMAEPPIRAACQKLADQVIYQISEYQKNGFEVLGILGINGSPTCGVEFNWGENCEEPCPGVFMQAILDACLQQHIQLSVRGMRAAQPQQAVETLIALLGECIF